MLELTAASSYNTLSNISTGTSTFGGVAVDGMGNVYGADAAANAIVKLDYVDHTPTLTFAATNASVLPARSSPQSVTLVNAGNMPLTSLRGAGQRHEPQHHRGLRDL